MSMHFAAVKMAWSGLAVPQAASTAHDDMPVLQPKCMVCTVLKSLMGLLRPCNLSICAEEAVLLQLCRLYR